MHFSNNQTSSGLGGGGGYTQVNWTTGKGELAEKQWKILEGEGEGEGSRFEVEALVLFQTQAGHGEVGGDDGAAGQHAVHLVVQQGKLRPLEQVAQAVLGGGHVASAVCGRPDHQKHLYQGRCSVWGVCKGRLEVEMGRQSWSL